MRTRIPNHGTKVRLLLDAIAKDRHAHPDEIRAQFVPIMGASNYLHNLFQHNIRIIGDRYEMSFDLRKALVPESVENVVPSRHTNLMNQPPFQMSMVSMRKNSFDYKNIRSLHA